jgi:hypothetical protein
VSRADAERVFGRELVADAVDDPDPVRLDDETLRAFAALAAEHRGSDLATFRLVVGAWLSSVPVATRRALVRTVAGGAAAELADVAREERRARMH